MSRIYNIQARQILDSRGNPTLEVEVLTENGIMGRASIPSGMSKGLYEASELRDDDKKNYLGKSVLKAVQNVNNLLNEELRGIYVTEQGTIDKTMLELDGTSNKHKIGANAILGVSLAAAKAAAIETNQNLYRYIGGVNAHTLPIPMINVINGGIHADNNIDFQEFLIMPLNADTFSDAIRIGMEVFYSLKCTLKEKGYSTNVGDEGGFAPNVKNVEEIIEIIIAAIKKAGYKPEKDVFIAIDIAASELYDSEKKKYILSKSNKEELSSNDLINEYTKLVNKYPVISIEDGLEQDDWNSWSDLTRKLGNKIQIVGDDIFATNVERLRKGCTKGVANSILIKLNQIGTLSEAIETINFATNNNYTSIVSHRSGETEDTIIADLAVALNTGLIKAGGGCRSERIAKYNQLIRIEEQLGESAYYPGKDFMYKYIK